MNITIPGAGVQAVFGISESEAMQQTQAARLGLLHAHVQAQADGLEQLSTAYASLGPANQSVQGQVMEARDRLSVVPDMQNRIKAAASMIFLQAPIGSEMRLSLMRYEDALPAMLQPLMDGLGAMVGIAQKALGTASGAAAATAREALAALEKGLADAPAWKIAKGAADGSGHAALTSLSKAADDLVRSMAQAVQEAGMQLKASTAKLAQAIANPFDSGD